MNSTDTTMVADLVAEIEAGSGLYVDPVLDGRPSDLPDPLAPLDSIMRSGPGGDTVLCQHRHNDPVDGQLQLAVWSTVRHMLDGGNVTYNAGRWVVRVSAVVIEVSALASATRYLGAGWRLAYHSELHRRTESGLFDLEDWHTGPATPWQASSDPAGLIELVASWSDDPDRCLAAAQAAGLTLPGADEWAEYITDEKAREGR